MFSRFRFFSFASLATPRSLNCSPPVSVQLPPPGAAGCAAHAELDADAEVELFEARQQRDGVEIEIGDVRRPARAGVAPLHAAEAQRLQLRQQLQEIQVQPGDQRGADLQLLELAQIRQVLEADVAEHRVADVERPQPGHLADVRHAGVGDVDAAHDQPAQRAIRAQVRHRRIGQELGGVERQIFELLQRLQLLDAAIGDVGERQIELLDRLELDDEVDVVVGRPRALERRFDDDAVLVARDPAASLLDALDGMRDRRRILLPGLCRRRSRRTTTQPTTQAASARQRVRFRLSIFVSMLLCPPPRARGVEAPVDLGVRQRLLHAVEPLLGQLRVIQVEILQILLRRQPRQRLVRQVGAIEPELDETRCSSPAARCPRR